MELDFDQSNVIVCKQNDTAASVEPGIDQSDSVDTKQFDTETAKSDPLLVDSGCTSHIVNDDKNFIEEDPNYKPENHTIEFDTILFSFCSPWSRS